MDEKITFGNYLRELRERIDMPLKQVAHAVGVSTPYLSDVEKGNRLPLKAENLFKLFNFMGFTDETREELISLAKIGLLKRHGY